MQYFARNCMGFYFEYSCVINIERKVCECVFLFMAFEMQHPEKGSVLYFKFESIFYRFVGFAQKITVKICVFNIGKYC